MATPRGKEHTTLTETAKEVVRVLERLPGIKMIAPGVINTGARKRSGERFVTVVYTSAGFELIISGQSVQKVSVHLKNSEHCFDIVLQLKQHKKMSGFTFKERERKPGV